MSDNLTMFVGAVAYSSSVFLVFGAVPEVAVAAVSVICASSFAVYLIETYLSFRHDKRMFEELKRHNAAMEELTKNMSSFRTELGKAMKH